MVLHAQLLAKRFAKMIFSICDMCIRLCMSSRHNQRLSGIISAEVAAEVASLPKKPVLEMTPERALPLLKDTGMQEK